MAVSELATLPDSRVDLFLRSLSTDDITSYLNNMISEPNDTAKHDRILRILASSYVTSKSVLLPFLEIVHFRRVDEARARLMMESIQSVVRQMSQSNEDIEDSVSALGQALLLLMKFNSSVFSQQSAVQFPVSSSFPSVFTLLPALFVSLELLGSVNSNTGCACLMAESFDLLLGNQRWLYPVAVLKVLPELHFSQEHIFPLTTKLMSVLDDLADSDVPSMCDALVLLAPQAPREVFILLVTSFTRCPLSGLNYVYSVVHSSVAARQDAASSMFQSFEAELLKEDQAEPHQSREFLTQSVSFMLLILDSLTANCEGVLSTLSNALTARLTSDEACTILRSALSLPMIQQRYRALLTLVEYWQGVGRMKQAHELGTSCSCFASCVMGELLRHVEASRKFILRLLLPNTHPADPFIFGTLCRNYPLEMRQLLITSNGLVVPLLSSKSPARLSFMKSLAMVATKNPDRDSDASGTSYIMWFLKLFRDIESSTDADKRVIILGLCKVLPFADATAQMQIHAMLQEIPSSLKVYFYRLLCSAFKCSSLCPQVVASFEDCLLSWHKGFANSKSFLSPEKCFGGDDREVILLFKCLWSLPAQARNSKTRSRALTCLMNQLQSSKLLSDLLLEGKPQDAFGGLSIYPAQRKRQQRIPRPVLRWRRFALLTALCFMLTSFSSISTSLSLAPSRNPTKFFETTAMMYAYSRKNGIMRANLAEVVDVQSLTLLLSEFTEWLQQLHFGSKNAVSRSSSSVKSKKPPLSIAAVRLIVDMLLISLTDHAQSQGVVRDIFDLSFRLFSCLQPTTSAKDVEAKKTTKKKPKLVLEQKSQGKGRKRPNSPSPAACTPRKKAPSSGTVSSPSSPLPWSSATSSSRATQWLLQSRNHFIKNAFSHQVASEFHLEHVVPSLLSSCKRLIKPWFKHNSPKDLTEAFKASNANITYLRESCLRLMSQCMRLADGRKESCPRRHKKTSRNASLDQPPADPTESKADEIESEDDDVSNFCAVPEGEPLVTMSRKCDNEQDDEHLADDENLEDEEDDEDLEDDFKEVTKPDCQFRQWLESIFTGSAELEDGVAGLNEDVEELKEGKNEEHKVSSPSLGTSASAPPFHYTAALQARLTASFPKERVSAIAMLAVFTANHLAHAIDLGADHSSMRLYCELLKFLIPDNECVASDSTGPSLSEASPSCLLTDVVPSILYTKLLTVSGMKESGKDMLSLILFRASPFVALLCAVSMIRLCLDPSSKVNFPAGLNLNPDSASVLFVSTAKNITLSSTAYKAALVTSFSFIAGFSVCPNLPNVDLVDSEALLAHLNLLSSHMLSARILTWVVGLALLPPTACVFDKAVVVQLLKGLCSLVQTVSWTLKHLSSLISTEKTSLYDVVVCRRHQVFPAEVSVASPGKKSSKINKSQPRDYGRSPTITPKTNRATPSPRTPKAIQKQPVFTSPNSTPKILSPICKLDPLPPIAQARTSSLFDLPPVECLQPGSEEKRSNSQPRSRSLRPSSSRIAPVPERSQPQASVSSLSTLGSPCAANPPPLCLHLWRCLFAFGLLMEPLARWLSSNCHQISARHQIWKILEDYRKELERLPTSQIPTSVKEGTLGDLLRELALRCSLRPIKRTLQAPKPKPKPRRKRQKCLSTNSAINEQLQQSEYSGQDNYADLNDFIDTDSD